MLNFNVEAQCTPVSLSALMTGRFSIRSGTYAVPIGGQADGLTLWEITIAELLSVEGYSTSKPLINRPARRGNCQIST